MAVGPILVGEGAEQDRALPSGSCPNTAEVAPWREMSSHHLIRPPVSPTGTWDAQRARADHLQVRLGGVKNSISRAQARAAGLPRVGFF